MSQRVIVMPAPGRAVLQAVDDAAGTLADDEVVGTSLSSVISPGTELGMQFLATAGFPHRPGYGAVFRVDAIGSRVAGIAVGTTVSASARSPAGSAAVNTRRCRCRPRPIPCRRRLPVCSPSPGRPWG